jgi:hypothetical protein
MPQLTIAADPAPSFAGQISYPMLPRVVVTRAVPVGQTIGFGLAVVRAADRSVRLPAAGGEITGTFEGFTVRQQWREDNGVGYVAGEAAPIMRRGFIWVESESAVTEEGAVFARTGAGAGGTQLGALRGDADGGTATAVPNARFVTSTTAAGLAIVEVW